MSTRASRKRSNDGGTASQKKVKVSDTSVGTPLRFDCLLGRNQVNRDNDEVCSNSKGLSCAVSNAVMSEGRHYATFERSGCECSLVHIGIMRPIGDQLVKSKSDWDDGFSPIDDDHTDLLVVEPSRWGSGNVHACMRLLEPGKKSGIWSNGSSCFDTKKNQRECLPEWGEWSFCRREHVTLGLLLDLDAGTLSVWENGKDLGVLKTGLTGEYCWCTTIFDIQDGTAIRIKKGSIDDGSQPKISDFFKRA